MLSPETEVAPVSTNFGIDSDERVFLQPLAARPYRPLILIPAEPQAPTRVQGVPSVVVERRPLSAYSRIAGGAR